MAVRAKVFSTALALALAVTSCGFISGGQEVEADGVLGPYARNGTLPPTTALGNDYPSTTRVPGSAPVDDESDGDPVANDQSDRGASGSSSGVVGAGQVPTSLPQPSPELNEAAVASCRLVTDVQASGLAILEASRGQSAVPTDLVQANLDAVRAIARIVPERQGDVVERLEAVMTPTTVLFAAGPPWAQLGTLQGFVDRVAPDITALLTAVYPVCPQELSAETLDQAEGLQLG